MSTRMPFSLAEQIEVQKSRLSQHPIYTAVQTVDDLQIFMERHVGCVLDFMSILKSLQRDLTCVRTPWGRPAHPAAARLINEIVLGEETDEIAPGVYTSHFQWYLEAMEELGADTRPIVALEEGFLSGIPVEEAIDSVSLPPETAAFMRHTFSLLDAPVSVRAAVFFHGREDVIPRMFLPLAETLERSGAPCRKLVGYLRRHIEVDGEEHGPAAMKLLSQLFDGDRALEECRRRRALDTTSGSTLRRPCWPDSTPPRCPWPTRSTCGC